MMGQQASLLSTASILVLISAELDEIVGASCIRAAMRPAIIWSVIVRKPATLKQLLVIYGYT